MQEFTLPDLGEGMQEAEIRRWLIQPGESVRLDQPMVEVETDKAVVEIPAPIAGRVGKILVQEGAVAKLGEPLILFDIPDQTREPATVNNGKKSPASLVSTPVQPGNTPKPESSAHRVLAAPAVRKRAFELGFDLAQIPSSHPTGRITLDDLQRYIEHQKQGSVVLRAEQPASNGSKEFVAQQKPVVGISSGNNAQVAEERQPLTGLRKRIAEHMERSWRIIPHATAFDELDGTELVALRQGLKPLAEQRGVRLTYMPILIKLLLPLLKEFPIFNASLDEERREIIYKHVYHLGIATDSPEGLLVTVLRNADQLTIIQLAQQLEYLTSGAQKRTLALNEVSGSTFTLNNIGSFGGGSGTPIINHPEVAILAVGRLQEKAVVRHGTVIPRTMMPLALSFDHRVIDGALAGRFLARFKDLVERPQQLLLDLV